MDEAACKLSTDAEISINEFISKIHCDLTHTFLESLEFNEKIQFTDAFKVSHDHKDDSDSFVYIGNLHTASKLKFSSTYVDMYIVYTLYDVYKSLYDMQFIHWYLSRIEYDVGEMYFYDRSYMFSKIEFVRIPVISMDKQLEIMTKIDKLKSINETINKSLDSLKQLYS